MGVDVDGAFVSRWARGRSCQRTELGIHGRRSLGVVDAPEPATRPSAMSDYSYSPKESIRQNGGPTKTALTCNFLLALPVVIGAALALSLPW